MIRATPQGWEYESDQRHVEIILEQLGLNVDNTKPLSTPGVEETTSRHGDMQGTADLERLLKEEMVS